MTSSYESAPRSTILTAGFKELGTTQQTDKRRATETDVMNEAILSTLVRDIE